MNRQTEYASRLSPFRYPGGKAFLHEMITQHVNRMNGPARNYVEPYAGGAGAALILLSSGKVSRVHLNDADICVYEAWRSILFETERFIAAVSDRPVTIETWWKCKAIIDKPSQAEDGFELGFATFFLNRTNRSGILRGAGPIGGYRQEGKWRIDARYYKETIISRARKLQKLADRVSLYNMDGLEFLKQSARRLSQNCTFYFIDPPYVQAGSRLYLNTMTDESHRALAQYLAKGRLKNWLLTYDDCELIRSAYSDMGISSVEVPYSLQKKRKEREVVVSRLNELQGTINA